MPFLVGRLDVLPGTGTPSRFRGRGYVHPTNETSLFLTAISNMAENRASSEIFPTILGDADADIPPCYNMQIFQQNPHNTRISNQTIVFLFLSSFISSPLYVCARPFKFYDPSLLNEFVQPS